MEVANPLDSSKGMPPSLTHGHTDMFIGGNDAEAKKVVTGILTKLGWNTVDLGGIDAARLLEPLCLLWLKYGIVTGGWNHALKMLRK
jgi:predicted dinucleotide-binding enzyme